MSELSLHTLRPAAGSRKVSQRVGRGGKRGTTAGRGTKGQRARSGGRNKLSVLGMRHVLLQTPQRRGHAQKAAKSFVTVNLGDLERVYAAGETVTLKSLVAKGVIKDTARPLKVLGGGKLAQSLTVKARAFSAGARAAIERAGGTVVKL